MAPKTASARLETPSPSCKNASDSGSQFGPLTQGPSNSGFVSDSDSLDSTASRKRRKISSGQIQDDDQDDTSIPSRIPLLSRVKARIGGNVDNAIAPTNAILVPTDSQTTFESLHVKPWLVSSLNSMAIKQPTGIQKGCIPEILKGRDCIGGSRTGSGKTVAFAVPILQKWAEDPVGIFAVIMTPTRYGCDSS